MKRLWPQQLHSLQVLEVLVQNGDWAGLGSRRLRGFLHIPDPGGAHASHIRTKSASTTATWTSSGSTPLNRLCPMDCPTTEEAFEERGPPGHFQTAPSLLHGHVCAVLVWEEMTRPVHSSVLTLQISTVIPGDQLQKRRERPEAHVRG